jgi:hypothetical protein
MSHASNYVVSCVHQLQIIERLLYLLHTDILKRELNISEAKWGEWSSLIGLLNPQRWRKQAHPKCQLTVYQWTWRHNPENMNPHQHHCKNLKSCIKKLYLIMYHVWLSFYSVAIGDPTQMWKNLRTVFICSHQKNNMGPERCKRESKT